LGGEHQNVTQASWLSIEPESLVDGLRDEGFLELLITAPHLVRVSTLPWHHCDPFDRLLVAQAEVERCALWTTDRTLGCYGSQVQVVS
jgi:PIN domain nuclease of toxin-antitoxin system